MLSHICGLARSHYLIQNDKSGDDGLGEIRDDYLYDPNFEDEAEMIEDDSPYPGEYDHLSLEPV